MCGICVIKMYSIDELNSLINELESRIQAIENRLGDLYMINEWMSLISEKLERIERVSKDNECDIDHVYNILNAKKSLVQLDLKDITKTRINYRRMRNGNL